MTANIQNNIAQFESVPFKQFKQDMITFMNQHLGYKSKWLKDHTPITKCCTTVSEDEMENCKELDEFFRNMWENLECPARPSSKSAGYNFKTPISFTLSNYQSETSITIPTGIRCRMEPEWFLYLMPSKELGLNGIRIAETGYIADADYYESDNYGHIIIKLVYEPAPYDPALANEKEVEVLAGQTIVRGIFLPYGLTYNDSLGNK